MSVETDPIDEIVNEAIENNDIDPLELANLKLFGELVRAVWLLALAADEIKDAFTPPADVVKH